MPHRNGCPGNGNGVGPSLSGLSWLNFLTALMQTAFGAFLAVYLTTHGWSRTEVGFALSAGAAAGLLSQVPAGMLVDWLAAKRAAAAGAVLAIMGAALLIAVLPSRLPVYAAEVVQGAAAAVLTPAIAALTLALARHEKLGERLGRNVRFGAVGSAVAAVIMGLVGAGLSHRAIFWVATGCAPLCLLAIARIRFRDLATAHTRGVHPSGVHPRRRAAPPDRIMQVALDRPLLIFAGCLLLFQLGNAALLPTAAGELARTMGPLQDIVPAELWSGLPDWHLRGPDLLVAAWIVVPQLLAAALSPALGRYAQSHGRLWVLLVGFAAMPVRAGLFALDGGPGLIILYQTLDGVSAAAFGVMIPLVAADVTRSRGRFNLAMGILGLAGGIGGALSTAVAGRLADLLGEPLTFGILAATGLLGCLLLWLMMPETHPTRPDRRRHRRPRAKPTHNGDVPAAK